MAVLAWQRDMTSVYAGFAGYVASWATPKVTAKEDNERIPKSGIIGTKTV